MQCIGQIKVARYIVGEYFSKQEIDFFHNGFSNILAVFQMLHKAEFARFILGFST